MLALVVMDKMNKIEIPTELEHIEFVRTVAKIAEAKTSNFSDKSKNNLKLLGDSMHAIYLSAACVNKCIGGDHQIEYIGARVYNLSAASYNLIVSGFYDEAQSLIRSIGEISNLLSLAVFNFELFDEWKKSDKQKRMNKFSPAKVRQIVENSNGVLIMDKNLYSKLCEEYTHLVPAVKPNNYDHDQNVCGGLAQQAGFEQSVNLLSYIVSMLALFFCTHSELKDEFNKIESAMSE